MSGRENESLAEQMSQGHTALDIIDNDAKPPDTAFYKAKEVIKKPFEHIKGSSSEHGKPKTTAGVSEGDEEDKKEVAVEEKEVS